MTSFVTREEFDRLSARLDALERLGAEVTVTSSAGDADEKIARLVRRGVEASLAQHAALSRLGATFMAG